MRDDDAVGVDHQDKTLRDLSADFEIDAVDHLTLELEDDHAELRAVIIPDRSGKEDAGLARRDADGKVGNDVLALQGAPHVVAGLFVVPADHVRAGRDNADALRVGKVGKGKVGISGKNFLEPMLHLG